MADVFISYCHDDRIKASMLAEALRAQGWTVWRDRDLYPGVLWEQTIISELKSAHCVIVAWSEASSSSSFVREEAGLALAHNKMLPVTLDQTAPPPQFRNTEVLDFSRWLGSEKDENFLRLNRGIERLLGIDPTVSARPAGRISKNRSRLKVWGITVGGTFFGVASGVIAKPLGIAAVASLFAVISVTGYLIVLQSSTPNKPTVAVWADAAGPKRGGNERASIGDKRRRASKRITGPKTRCASGWQFRLSKCSDPHPSGERRA
jgi:hypothetical protein